MLKQQFVTTLSKIYPVVTTYKFMDGEGYMAFRLIVLWILSVLGIAYAVAQSVSTDRQIWELVRQAIENDDDAKINALFSQYPSQLSDVNVNIGGNSTFIDYAASYCRVKAAAALLKLGADPNKSYNPITTQDSQT